MFREISPPGGTHYILYVRRQPWLALKLLPNVIIFPLGKICLCLGSARIPLFLESYQSALFPFYSALSVLIGIFVSEVEENLLLFLSNTIKALSFWLCGILYLIKKENKGFYFCKD